MAKSLIGSYTLECKALTKFTYLLLRLEHGDQRSTRLSIRMRALAVYVTPSTSDARKYTEQQSPQLAPLAWRAFFTIYHTTRSQ
ncbi:hypothetical protein AVEN_26314-1 [Araneus ventricosus]|uniref:Uncharacterized protein n=1 Tax=Araneus ventricosus TaxID=182803 RepID=A0A4Y2ANP7_ARAVE|nr:hypothetical protein AVEN_26314-1 [Araneus ventricosus]